MRSHPLLALFAAMICSVSPIARAQAQTPGPAHSGFPVNVVIPQPPAPVVAAGRTRLVYELHLTNFAPMPFDLAGIEVVAGDSVLASWRGDALAAMLMPVGTAGEMGSAARTLAAGRSLVAFIDLTLPAGAAVPAGLSHRLLFTAKIGDGATIERTVSGVAVTVGPPAPVIGAPLRGAGWVAANGLFAPDHRRSFNAVDGHEHLAQRFAIDWVRLGPDGRFFRPNGSLNTNFSGYGAAVIAVADGTVSAVIDGQPENEGNNPVSSRTVTLDSITGNSLVLDLGQGRYALYAHLQPGSIKVAVGDKVRAGQVLAKLGNSGNSDAPHLHFQLMDANSPLGAEGLPYAIAGFTQNGILPDLSGLDTGQPWPGEPGPAAAHSAEFPVDNAVVTFP